VILYPAIDLKDGACVRLVRGEMASATVFNRDPAGQARQFAASGFEWLHVVDLNGAFAGRSVNGAAVAAIRDSVGLRLQLGGGIRDREEIDKWLGLGIDRVVLGTAALHDPEMVRQAAADHPGAIAVGIDARAGRVAVAGWAEETEIGVVELARRFEDCGVAAIIHTDIAATVRWPGSTPRPPPRWRVKSAFLSSPRAGLPRLPISPPSKRISAAASPGSSAGAPSTTGALTRGRHCA